MPITSTNPFKWRHFPGEVILLSVRWYLRYPLAYEHVAELLAERGVAVHATCIWRWVQTYAPELNKRCRPHLKATNKSYRTDETYIKVKGEDKFLYRAVDSAGRTIDFLLTAKRDAGREGSEFSRECSAASHQCGPEPSLSAGGGKAENGRDFALSCPSAPMQVSQQRSGTRPPHGKETDLAGQRLRFVPDGVADIARNRSGEHDSEGPGEVGGQTRCRSGRRLHQRVIRHRRLTLHLSLSFIVATPFTSTNSALLPKPRP